MIWKNKGHEFDVVYENIKIPLLYKNTQKILEYIDNIYRKQIIRWKC